MKNITNRFVLDSDGINTLTSLANILGKKSSVLRNTGFNMLLVYEDIREARLFVSELGRYIAKNATKHHVYQCSEDELDTVNLFRKWRANAAAFFIFADDTHSLDQRMRLGAIIQQIPEIIFCLCISSAELKRALKQNDHLYNHVFHDHIHIDFANASVITSRFLEVLKKGGYEISDAFENDITEYISVVYPKADLKNEEFIDDLRKSVLNNHYGGGNEGKLIKDSSVPHYEKPENSKKTPPAVFNIGLNPFPVEEAKEKLNKSLQSGTSDKKADKETDKKPDINILICSISLLPGRNAKNYYYSKLPNSENHANRMFIFEGISQLEPGTKYMLNKLALEGKRIDRIILYCSYKSHHEKRTVGNGFFSKTNDDDASGFTAVDYYIGKIRDYMNGKETFIRKDDSRNCFVELPKTPSEERVNDLKEAEDAGYTTVDDGRILYFDSDNRWALDYQLEDEGENGDNAWIYTVKEDKNANSIDTLTQFYNLVEKECNRGKVHIYLDAQGGVRSFFNLYYSLFSMFDKSKIVIEEVCATLFEPTEKVHPICDATDEYRAIKLVSAINAFSLYGRGDQLTEYFSNESTQKLTDNEKTLLGAIQKVSESISISDPNGFNDGLGSMRTALGNLKGTTSNSYLTLLKNDIQLKYGPLLTEEKTSPLEIVRWCNANKFTQQALAFIEDKMPTFILSKILPTEISEKADKSSNFRQIEDPDYAVANLNLVKNIKGNNHKTYNTLSNTVLHNVTKVLVDNENNSYVKDVIVWLSTNIKNEETTLLPANIPPILKAAKKLDKNTVIQDLVSCIIKSDKIDLLNFIDVDFDNGTNRTTLRNKYFNSKINNEIEACYYNWDDSKKYIGPSYIPTSSTTPAIFREIKPRATGNNIKNFYQDFYKFVFNEDYPSVGSRKPTISFIKSAFCEFSDFHTQILGSQDCVNILKKDFASILFDATTKGNEALKENMSNLIKAYCQFLGLSFSTDNNSIVDLNSVFESLYAKHGILDDVKDKVANSTYTAETSKKEYEELTTNPLKCDSVTSIAEESINKYCAFREHEHLRGNKEEFVPTYWDFRILKDFNNIWNLSHDFHFYSTIVGKAGDVDGDQVTISMTAPEDKGILKMSYYSQDKDLLDLYLRLHFALKQERNNSSHAAESELRLPFSVIETMISQYIAISDGLLNH